MSRIGLFVLFIPFLIWHVAPSGAATEMPQFECAGRTGVGGERGKLTKRIRRGWIQSKGYVHVLVVFARFKDEAPSEVWAPAYAQDLFDPEVPGSFSHFYREMSRGQLSVSGTCLKKRYASAHDARYYFGLGDELGDRVGTFTKEILAQVDREGDFGQYDNDGPDGIPNSGDDDGYVDFLFLNLRTVPAGFLRATATGIASLGLAEDYATNDPAKGGGIIMISNAFGAMQQVNNFSHAVGVMAHEFGHALGLPDLYDESFLFDPDESPEEDSAGIGKWGLMARGTLGWNDDDGPNPMCAWSREQLGWIGEDNRDVVDVTEDREDAVIRCVWKGGKVYRIPLNWDSRTGSATEYFLIEHRQPSGGYYDRNMPGSGLLIWHVTDSRDNRDETYKRVDLECADGRFAARGYPEGRVADPIFGRDNLDFWAHDERYRREHSGNLGDATDPFDGVRFTAFSLDTNPTSDDRGRSYRDASTGFAVTNIRRQGSDMMADFSVPKWSGSITRDIVWGGTIRVIGDVDVQKDAKLILQPGTQVRIATSDATVGGLSPARCEIYVIGSLISRGTSASPVVFSSAATVPGDADWYGIRLHPQAKPPETLEGTLTRHSKYGIFWDKHRGESGLTLNDSRVKDNLGNGDGRANPGETFLVEFRLGNWSFVTFGPVYVSLTSDDPFVRKVGKRVQFSKVKPGKITYSKSISVTLGSNCPQGREVKFDVDISTRGRNRGNWTERFTLRVTGEDESAPVVERTSVSAKYVPIGETATISARVREPGPIRSVRAKIVSVSDSTQVAFVPLQEDDKKEGWYTGSWSPSLGSDFEVYVEATDERGNRGISREPATFFSYPFDKAADVLVYAEKQMRGLCAEALRGRGISYDLWDYGERGSLDQKTLYRYSDGVVIWTLTRGAQDKRDGESVVESMRRYLVRGGNLLLLVGNLGSLPSSSKMEKAEMERFYEEVLRVKYLGMSRGRLTGADGDPIAEGFSARLSSYGGMSVREPAKPILTDESGRAAAVRVDGGNYRVVYFAFNVGYLKSSVDQENLVGGATEWLMEKHTVRARDVALERVLAPERYTNRVAVIPSVQIVNLGRWEEREIPVVCTIARDGRQMYTDRQTVRSLGSGETRRFSFRPWVPKVGTYEFTFYLDLPGDEDESNNVLTTATDVGAFLDVSSSAGIDRPGQGRGVAMGDYDNDGDLDVFVARYDGPDLLYRNDRGRLFSEGASQAGVGVSGKTRAAAWGDYDNDGDLDLYVSSEEGANRLYRNEGDGTFTNATMWAGVGDLGPGRAAIWGDYDNDGDLDLYVANADGRGVLYRNLGSGLFVRATSAGVDSTGDARAATWWDYDNDGDLDLYVVAYYKGNVLYRNEGDGTFTDRTKLSGLDDRGKCNALAVGDYDNDGDLDLYVCKRGLNALYRNEGEGTFTNVTSSARVGGLGESIGASWGDYDNDGWLDLYVVNYRSRPNVLYRNEGEGVFRDVAGSAGVGDDGDGLGVAFADYDNDGYLDLYVTNEGPDVLYRNRGGSHHWLRVRTVGHISNRDGIGSRVKVVAGGLRGIREISGGGGYCSQDGLWAQFGLGDHAKVDSLVVRWPSGMVSALTSFSADREIMVREPASGKLVMESARAAKQVTAYPNPFNANATIQYTLSQPGRVRISIYDALGQEVRRLVEGHRDVGSHRAMWDGKDRAGRATSSGIYFYRLDAERRTWIGKVLRIEGRDRVRPELAPATN